ncbi:MAG: VWA domain-containing protein [Eggerthellaceae bacterium]|nr:VWA domain-containing protein [Eggerthellaceae bacterium]
MKHAHTNASPTVPQRGVPALLLAVAVLLASLALLPFAPSPAHAAEGEQPSVLIVDSNMGDLDLLAMHWLGQEVEVVAEEGGMQLSTSSAPVWWADNGGKEGAPSTFVLGSPSAAPLTADSIVWALDAIRAAGAQPKTFVVAMGPAGLPVREYAEDLANTKQSARADIVGLAFCGTAHNGYSVINSYPELTLWDTIAAAIGRTRADIQPQSEYLTSLEQGRFPRTSKTLVVTGSVGDLGFGATDGSAIGPDLSLSSAVAGDYDTALSDATACRAVDLSGQWGKFTNRIDYPDRLVDEHLTELLSTYPSYCTVDDIQPKVREFYETWFAGTNPVTHISNVIALDLSGSMLEEIVPGTIKIDSAKGAARAYLQAAESSDSMPYAAPINIDLTGFSTTLANITSGYDDGARNAVTSMEATHNETNIGIAFDDAVAKLGGAPACADKRILLLSDGATTEGATNEQMLSGVVANAASSGIVIDTIGFGDVGESNSAFLDQVAAATGGTYYQAADTYELVVNFLRSYYASQGLGFVDDNLAEGDVKNGTIGTVGASTAALNVGVVGNGYSPQIRLLCNGEPVADEYVTTQQEGNFTVLQCVNPPYGEYSVEVSGGSGNAHLFGLQQKGINRGRTIMGEELDYSRYLLIATAALLAVGLIATIVLTMRKKKAS